MIFEKKNFCGPRPDTPYRKFWKKFFFPNLFFFKKKLFLTKKFFWAAPKKFFFPIFVFLQKKSFEKKFFSGSHPDRPYLFLKFFFEVCPKCQYYLQRAYCNTLLFKYLHIHTHTSTQCLESQLAEGYRACFY